MMNIKEIINKCMQEECPTAEATGNDYKASHRRLRLGGRGYLVVIAALGMARVNFSGNLLAGK